jgi:hypothetical protein
VGALLAHVTMTPWMENPPVALATMTVPPQTVALRLDTGLPFEQWCTHQVGQTSIGLHLTT